MGLIVSNNSISNSIKALKQACDSQDWTQLKRIDEQILSDVQSMVESAQSEQEKQKLASYLTSIHRIYQLVIEGSEKHRDEISAELRKITQDRRAANSYLESSLHVD